MLTLLSGYWAVASLSAAVHGFGDMVGTADRTREPLLWTIIAWPRLDSAVFGFDHFGVGHGPLEAPKAGDPIGDGSVFDLFASARW